jgi:hypothetical protein
LEGFRTQKRIVFYPETVVGPVYGIFAANKTEVAVMWGNTAILLPLSWRFLQVRLLSTFKKGSITMQSIPRSSGDSIKARCTKCRKNTDHVIVTMVEGAPVMVQCNTCNRQHKYRPPTSSKASPRRTIDPKDVERKEWKALRPGMNGNMATDYSMTASYRVRDLINHPVFGLGLVQRIVGPRKVAVLFEDGEKTMRCK